MRILYIHHTDAVGGAELSIIELVSELVNNGVEAVALLPVGTLSRRFEKIGAKVITVPIPKLKRTLNPMKIASYISSRMKFSALAKEIIETEKIDVVHFNSLSAAVLFGDGITNKAPAVLHLRDSIVPKVVFGTMASNLTAYISISRYMSTVLMDYLKIPSHKVFEITNGLALPAPADMKARKNARKELGISRNTIVFFSASAFVPWKNHKSLFDAFRRTKRVVEDSKLILCGKDPTGQNSVSVQKIKISAEIFGEDCDLPGFVKNINKYYQAADIFVHPAVGEPFGRAVVEAQANSLPVVAYKSGSMDQVIVDGVTGFTTELSSQAFADAMVKLALDKRLRGKMGRAGAKRVLELFTVQRCASEVLKLYQSMILDNLPKAPDAKPLPVPQKELRRQKKLRNKLES